MPEASRPAAGSVRTAAADTVPPVPTDIDVVRTVYEAMAAGDLDRLLELVDETCVITQDARLPWGGRHEGHAGLATFAARLRGAIASAVTTDALFAADGE